MVSYSKTIELRWSDLDPNFHVLHSKYYDLGAFCRMAFLVENGLTPAVMQEHNVGPILFREECIFRKELNFSDEVRIDLTGTAARSDYSRWSMQHNIWKNGDTLAAVIKVDGAWMDTKLRKLTAPPSIVYEVFNKLPKSPDFQFSSKTA